MILVQNSVWNMEESIGRDLKDKIKFLHQQVINVCFELLIVLN